jgi:type IV pilus assembly protein PilA
MQDTMQANIFRRFYGLTLIEFMIVLAVAGILVAMVIPQLQNALVRNKVSEGLALTADAKALIEKNAIQGAPNLGQGVKPITANRAVKSMTVTNTSTGEIEVKFGEVAGAASIILVPYIGAASAPVSLVAGKALPSTTPVLWACKAQGSLFALGGLGSTLPEHAPDQCK